MVKHPMALNGTALPDGLELPALGMIAADKGSGGPVLIAAHNHPDCRATWIYVNRNRVEMV